MTAPDRAKLVSGVERVLTKLSRYDIANHRGKYALLRDESIAVLQRASDMIVSLDKQLWATDKAYQINKNSWEREFKQRCERDDRIAELETAITAATKAPLPETIKQTVAELREWSKDQRYGYFPGTLKDAANWLESLSRYNAQLQDHLQGACGCRFEEDGATIKAWCNAHAAMRDEAQAKCSALEADGFRAGIEAAAKQCDGYLETIDHAIRVMPKLPISPYAVATNLAKEIRALASQPPEGKAE